MQSDSAILENSLAISYKTEYMREYTLAVQCLGLNTSIAKGPGSLSQQRTNSLQAVWWDKKKQMKQTKSKKRKTKMGTSLMVQQLRLQASKAGDASSIPDQGNRITYAIRCSQWGRKKKKPKRKLIL